MMAAYTGIAGWRSGESPSIEEADMLTSHKPHHHIHINPLPLIVLGVLILAVLAVVVSLEAPVNTIDRDKLTRDTRPRFPSISAPDNVGSDYYERHRLEIGVAAQTVGVDYFMRHPELTVTRQPDTTDYYFRLIHP